MEMVCPNWVVVFLMSDGVVSNSGRSVDGPLAFFEAKIAGGSRILGGGLSFRFAK